MNHPLPLTVIHYVVFNCAKYIERALCSALAQEGFELGKNYFILVSDNASSDNTADLVETVLGGRTGTQVLRNSVNAGFARGHNLGISKALELGAEYVVIANPDLLLEPKTLCELVLAQQADSSVGLCCPKLLRANEHLAPVKPNQIDAAGMYMTPVLRHFDRGSSELDRGQYDVPCYVFGASGALLSISRRCIEDVAFKTPGHYELFDEEFFVYREDADVSWRALLLGWRCLYWPSAVAFHIRLVVPEKRKILPEEINRWSVRNRFLLQFNNFTLDGNLHCVIPALIRNIMVIVACALVERSSWPGVVQALTLARRAFARRKSVVRRRRLRGLALKRWFSPEPVIDECFAEAADGKKIETLRIVVVNYRSADLLETCLKSIQQAISSIGNRLQVQVVIVNNQRDDSAEHSYLQQNLDMDPRFVFVNSEKNLGFAGGINRGAKDLIEDALLIINPDIQISAKAIDELCKTLERFPTAAIVAPVLCGSDQSRQLGYTLKRLPTIGQAFADLLGVNQLWAANPFREFAAYQDQPVIYGALNGESGVKSGAGPVLDQNRPVCVEQPAAACWLVRSQAYLKLGGFDEEFYPAWFEDVDFCKRLGAAGYHAVVNPQALVPHLGGYSVKAIGAGAFLLYYYSNMLRYWRRHASSAQYLVFRLLLLIGLVSRVMISAVSVVVVKNTADRGQMLGGYWKERVRLLKLAFFGPKPSF